MVQIEEQKFGLRKWFVRLSHAGVWIFGASAVLVIVVAVISFIESPENRGALVVYFIMMLVFAGFAFAGIAIVRQFGRAAVAVDNDGIWSTELGKSQGLIRWTDIGSIKERPTGQRLELLDSNGVSLNKLEYQLERFEDLREIVFERARMPDSEIQCPATFSKSVVYHVFTVLAIIGFAALSYCVSQTHAILALLGLGVMAMGINDYLKTPVKLTIDRRNVEVGYPHRTQSLGISEVDAIELADHYIHGSRLMEVLISTHTSQRPIRLKQISVQPAELYQLLTRWKNEKLFG